MTLKRRIFLTNTIMVLVCLCLLLVIVEMMAELLFEHYLGVSISALLRQLASGKWAAFIMAACVLGVLAMIGLLMISQLFTRHLTRQIMAPMAALMEGAARIDQGNMEKPVFYMGVKEFETLCQMFNTMQQHLREGMEEKEANEKARIEMVTGISHDLRTPLTAVKGYLKGILDGVAHTPEKQSDYLKAAYHRACDMETLLSKFFYFSKLQTGKMPLNTVPVDVGALMKDAMAAAARKHGEITLTCTIPEDRITLRLDPEQMTRIFENLITNSLAHAKVHSLGITLGLKSLGDKAVITVRDNGVGMPAEKLPHVFEQFYRGDAARSNSVENNGLGLYIVKTLVEGQGGRVYADVEDGFGVSMVFPMDQEGMEDEK